MIIVRCGMYFVRKTFIFWDNCKNILTVQQSERSIKTTKAYRSLDISYHYYSLKYIKCNYSLCLHVGITSSITWFGYRGKETIASPLYRTVQVRPDQINLLLLGIASRILGPVGKKVNWFKG